MTLSLGSLFSGIGGFELGVEAALSEAAIPHRLAWQVEIDPFCRAVLARHWPDADRSVTDVRAASSLPRVDVICGGFPCQDVSGAGKGAGLGGERSGLWFAYRDVVAALRPGIILVENVASGKRRWLCRVRSDLHALGYRTRAIQIGARDVGAPHRRERVFVVAYADRDRQQGERGGGLLDGERQAFGNDADGRDVQALGNAQGLGCRQGARPGAERGGLARSAAASGRQAIGGVGREFARLPHRLDLPARWPAGRGEEQEAWEPPRTVHERQPGRRQRLKALGNAVVPQVAREVTRVAVVPLLIGEARRLAS